MNNTVNIDETIQELNKQNKRIEELCLEIERLQHNQEVSTKWEIELTQKNTKLIEEIEKLNNIIDKALELIYANAYDTERKECIDDLWGSIEELVDILKGEDKE